MPVGVQAKRGKAGCARDRAVLPWAPRQCTAQRPQGREAAQHTRTAHTHGSPWVSSNQTRQNLAAAAVGTSQVNFVSEKSGGLGDVHVLTSAHGLLPSLLLEMRMVLGNLEPRVGSACHAGSARGRSGAGGPLGACVCVCGGGGARAHACQHRSRRSPATAPVFARAGRVERAAPAAMRSGAAGRAGWRGVGTP